MGNDEPTTAPGPTQEGDNCPENLQPKGRTPYRLYVGGLNYSTTTDTLRRAFEEFGAVLDGTEVIYDRSNNSKGFGFVNFVEEESMKKAIDKMNGHDLDGRKLQVMLAQPEMKKFGSGGYMGPKQHFGYTGHPGANRGFRISIQGVHPSVTWRDLKDFLRQAGEVRFADVFGPGLGMGEFATAADRMNALRMLNGKELKGSKLSMKEMNEMSRFSGGGGFGPRGPNMFVDNFYGNFDMPYGGGFDHGYGGMGPMDFSHAGCPPPPRMPAWGGRGGIRGGYAMVSYPPRSGYGRGNGRMNARWANGGYGSGHIGRGYDNQFKAFDGGPEASRPYDYDRINDGYGRTQAAGDQSGPYHDRMPPDRSYASYKDRYPGEAYSGSVDYGGSKEEMMYRMYANRSNPDALYGKYDSGQAPVADRGEGDVRGPYSVYRGAGEERTRDYADYGRSGTEDDRAPRDYGRSAYSNYSANNTSYAKQTVTADPTYDYDKTAVRTGNEEYPKYRNEDVYVRSDRATDVYSTQDRREYDYNARTDARTYSESGAGGVDYKARETDYYADRRGDYGNNRTYREDDPRGGGGVDRHRTRSHRTVPYER